MADKEFLEIVFQVGIRYRSGIFTSLFSAYTVSLKHCAGARWGPSKIKRGQSCISLVPILCQGLVGKESTCNAGEPGLIPGLGRSTGEGILLHSQVFLGFPCGSAGKESACNVEDLSLIPGLERSLGEGKGYPFQYSGLENSMICIVHGVAKSRT